MIGLVLSFALSSTPITLEEVRELSRRNTQAILQQLQVEQANAGVTGARAYIYPQLNFSGTGFGYYAGPQRLFTTVPTLTNGTVGYENKVVEVPGAGRGNFDFNVTVSQLIYDGGKWWTRIAQSGAQQEAAQGQFEEQELVSEFEGVRRFYELYRAQERKTVLDANVQRSTDQVGRAQGLFEAGRSQRGDLLAARVNLGNDQISALQQERLIASAQSDLAAWIAHPAAEDLLAQQPPLSMDVTLPELRAAIDEAQKNRPLYRALAAQVRSAEEGVALARADYYPQLSASATLGRAGPSVNPVFTDPTRQNYVSGGMNLRWNLFSGFATGANVQNAEAQKKTADLNLQQALYELEGQVKQAITALDVTARATKIAAANREIASEGLMVAEGRFASGAGSTLEVRDAQLKLTQAEITLLESRIDTEIARANLDKVLGVTKAGARP